jgi:hypothetical protein
MNYYVWEIRTKLAIIREYLEDSDSLSKMFTLGKTMKSVKQHMFQETAQFKDLKTEKDFQALLLQESVSKLNESSSQLDALLTLDATLAQLVEPTTQQQQPLPPSVGASSSSSRSFRLSEKPHRQQFAVAAAALESPNQSKGAIPSAPSKLLTPAEQTRVSELEAEIKDYQFSMAQLEKKLTDQSKRNESLQEDVRLLRVELKEMNAERLRLQQQQPQQPQQPQAQESMGVARPSMQISNEQLIDELFNTQSQQQQQSSDSRGSSLIQSPPTLDSDSPRHYGSFPGKGASSLAPNTPLMMPHYGTLSQVADPSTESPKATANAAQQPQVSTKTPEMDDFESLLDDLRQPIQTANANVSGNGSENNDNDAKNSPSTSPPPPVASPPPAADKDFDHWLEGLSNNGRGTPTQQQQQQQQQQQNGSIPSTPTSSQPPSLSNIPPNAAVLRTLREVEQIQQQQQHLGPLELMVRVDGHVVRLTFNTTQLIDDALKLACDSHPNFPKNSAIELEWGLFIPYPVGSWLKTGVKLAKYGLRPGVRRGRRGKKRSALGGVYSVSHFYNIQTELEIRVKSRGGFKQTSSQGDVLQFLKIEIPEGSETVTRTLKLSKENDTVRNVMVQIIKKYKSANMEEWGLWNPLADVWLNEDATLAQCNLKHMVSVLLMLCGYFLLFSFWSPYDFASLLFSAAACACIQKEELTFVKSLFLIYFQYHT